MKKCRVCKKIKKLNQFNRRDDGQQGVKWACKSCQKIKKSEGDLTRYKRLAKDPVWVKKTNQRNRRWYNADRKKNPEKYLRRAKKWRKANPEKVKKALARQRLKLRMAVLHAYSGKVIQCHCCKTKDVDVLAVDHINGGGNKHQKKLRAEGKLLYLELKKQGYPKGYQILCHNCNYKKHLRGKCSHKK
jgi:hypothetical protein